MLPFDRKPSTRSLTRPVFEPAVEVPPASPFVELTLISMDSMAATPALTLVLPVGAPLLLLHQLGRERAPNHGQPVDSFFRQSSTTRAVQVKERKTKRPWRELSRMKTYRRATTLGKAFHTNQMIHVNPIRLEI